MSADPPSSPADPQLLPELITSAPVAAAMLDRELRYRWVNPALCRLNGRSADEHLGRRPREILGPLGEQLEELLAGVIERGEPIVNYRFTGRRPNSGDFWMGSYYPICNRGGEVIAVGALVSDITEQERGVASEREFLVALVRVAQAVATHANAREVLNAVAREAARVLGLDGAVVACFRPGGVALEGRWGDVVAVAELGAVLPAATTPLTEMVRLTGRPQRLQTEEPDALGFRSRVAAPITVGGVLWGAVKAGSPAQRELPADAEDRLARFAELVGVAVSNASEQRRLIEEARRDPLTGLCNRRSFQERLESEAQRALRHAGGFSLVLLDIDEFKRVNDTHGHDVGDAVLIETARRLSQEVRAVDVLARVGGEEFAWILPDVSGPDALMAAERARQLIAAVPFDSAGAVTLSAGVASFDEAGGTDELFQQADRALYAAKHRGRNQSVRHAQLADAAQAPWEGADSVRVREAERSHAQAALRALSRAIDAKDPATFHHSERVAQLAQSLAEASGWPPERALALREAALLHDIGKVGVPERILFKPGPLTPGEYEQVKAHARLGCQIASEVITPEQSSWILHHHERWDGAGYPDGLSGEEIPQGAQLLALADAWDAMTGARHYAEPLAPDAALRECESESGRQFAPAAVDALRVLRDAAREPQLTHG